MRVREGMILVATDFSKNKKIQDLCPGFRRLWKRKVL